MSSIYQLVYVPEDRLVEFHQLVQEFLHPIEASVEVEPKPKKRKGVHRDCIHPNTKTARRRCRKERQQAREAVKDVEYPYDILLPEVGETYRLPYFMAAPEGTVYVVTESGVREWYGALRPVFSVIAINAAGGPQGRVYTDPWIDKNRRKRVPGAETPTEDLRIINKGPKDQIALWPDEDGNATMWTHLGEKVEFEDLTSGQQAYVNKRFPLVKEDVEESVVDQVRRQKPSRVLVEDIQPLSIVRSTLKSMPKYVLFLAELERVAPNVRWAIERYDDLGEALDRSFELEDSIAMLDEALLGAEEQGLQLAEARDVVWEPVKEKDEVVPPTADFSPEAARRFRATLGPKEVLFWRLLCSSPDQWVTADEVVAACSLRYGRRSIGGMVNWSDKHRKQAAFAGDYQYRKFPGLDQACYILKDHSDEGGPTREELAALLIEAFDAVEFEWGYTA